MSRLTFKLIRGYTSHCVHCRQTNVIRNFHISHKKCTESVKGGLIALRSRSLVRVAGRDAISYLQGLLTNDIALLAHSKAQYNMLLNVQGRVLYDLILYRMGSAEDLTNILLECDTTIADKLIADVSKYRLRKKVSIENVSDTYKVFASLGPYSPVQKTEDSVITQDPRVPAFGYRVISESGNVSEEGADEDLYHKSRLQWGIPEGVTDLPPANCLPLESNLVYMNGVSFSKGCYLGQELTARTHHTGVTRKRIMPLVFQEPPGDIAPGETIYNESKKNVGKFRCCVGSHGLGLIRMAEGSGRLSVTTRSSQTVYCTAIQPQWWPVQS